MLKTREADQLEESHKATAAEEVKAAEEAETTEQTLPDNPEPAAPEFDFRELCAQANSGDREAIVELREILDSDPKVWQTVGDLAAHARLSLIRKISQGDQLLFESLQRKTAAMETELLMPSSSSIERLIVERVVSVWLQLQYADMMFAVSCGDITQNKYWAQRQDQSHRRYLAVLKELAAIRGLLPGSAPSKKSKKTDAQPTTTQTSGAGSGQESHECDRTATTPKGDVDQNRDGHSGGKMNDHAIPPDMVVNDAQVEPDTCVNETERDDPPDSANGKPVNRILRFTTAPIASTG